MLSIHEHKYLQPIVNTNKLSFSKMCWSYTQVWADMTGLKKKTKNNSPSALFKAQGIQIFCSRLHFTFLCLDVIKYREETEENLQTKYYKFMGGKKGKEKKQIHGEKMGYSITVAGTSCSCKKN